MKSMTKVLTVTLFLIVLFAAKNAGAADCRPPVVYVNGWTIDYSIVAHTGDKIRVRFYCEDGTTGGVNPQNFLWDSYGLTLVANFTKTAERPSEWVWAWGKTQYVKIRLAGAYVEFEGVIWGPVGEVKEYFFWDASGNVYTVKILIMDRLSFKDF